MISEMSSHDFLIRTLIVDHDLNSRKAIIEILSKDPAIRIVSECSNGVEGMTAFHEFKPEILICEVETPGMDGFSILKAIPLNKRPATIFVSKHESFAVRAFEFSAADYIVKPIREDRLEMALSRARSQVEHSRTPLQLNSVERPRQLAIKTGRSVNFVKFDELDWAEAEGKYVRLHMGKECLVLKMSISALESELDPVQFVRIHRSTIINVDRVRRVQPWNHRRTYQVTLQDGTHLVLSRKTKLQEIKTASTF
ncbi:MAG TPA: LytTR family DNA-binding domain-containing protein [Acidobacteriota bacterium]